ncbi:MAG: tetratricopeptide repeat protein [Chitinispirillaceae bacterium]|jgi:tetratricopeptide (TPR) repeat protein
MKRYKEKSQKFSIGKTFRKGFRGGAIGNRDFFFGLLLLIITFFAYRPAWQGDFLWDDDAHITNPVLGSWAGLMRIWTEPGATQQYYPLAHSVFWLERRLFGDEPLGYHLLNILLHALSAFLLYRILRRLTIPGAWLAAAVFALHPIEVESVAWISELKNCLSGVFFFGAILSYLQFDQKRTLKWYLNSFGLFALGLISKSAIAPMPAVMLIILWWRRGTADRFLWKKDLLSLLPFFLAGVSFGLFTTWVERRFIIAEENIHFNYSFIERCLIAGRAFWFYLDKLVDPSNLTFFYRRWEVSGAVWRHYFFPLGVASLAAALWFFRRRSKAPLAALLYFVAMLFPALGFINVYPFRYSFVADHFQYLAGIGPLTLASAGLDLALSRMGQRFAPATRVVPVMLIAVLAILTWKQCGMYADKETLYRTAIQRNPECWLACNNLGLEYQRTERFDEAIACYRKAIEISPASWGSYFNLGDVLMQTGRTNEAITQFQMALDRKPGCAEAQVSLGIALAQTGQETEAVAHYRKALDIDPRFIPAFLNLGMLSLKSGKASDAAVYFQKALELKPDDFTILNNLCGIFLQIGKPDDAINAANQAMVLAKACGRKDVEREIERNIEEMRRAAALSNGEMEGMTNR